MISKLDIFLLMNKGLTFCVCVYVTNLCIHEMKNNLWKLNQIIKTVAFPGKCYVPV